MRVLILSADVGESHAAMATALARGLERMPEVSSVRVRSDFEVLGAPLGALLPRGFDYHLGRVQWSYDLAYRLFTGLAPARRAGEYALYRLGGGPLERTIASHDPDVVVSVYPVMNPVLSHLRAAGRLRCPVALMVGPLGGLGFWIQPHADLHLLHYAQAAPAVERIAGPGRALTVAPLVREEFLRPGSRAQARAALGIAAQERIVLVSGGGWGAGDLAGALEAALSLPGVRAIAVAGRNEELREELQRRFAAEARVEVLGFTERMRELLWAADAFVTATAGLSVIEARLCRCATVCFGFQVGHVRDNTAALARAGLARRASTPAELAGALRDAITGGQPPPWPLEGVPSAAEAVVQLARAGGHVSSSEATAVATSRG
jgi:UDP-N-acetylglucosamine:LPS N-acetylglucosamine transferase